MARMHSASKGRSGAATPQEKTSPSKLSTKEVEQIVIKLNKAGKTTSQIGMILRDSYGIPSTKIALQKKVTSILKEHNIKQELPENIVALIRKEIMLAKHLELNKKDNAAKRGLLLTESKIRRLVKYYKRTKVLPQGWKYSHEQAKLLVS